MLIPVKSEMFNLKMLNNEAKINDVIIIEIAAVFNTSFLFFSVL